MPGVNSRLSDNRIMSVSEANASAIVVGVYPTSTHEFALSLPLCLARHRYAPGACVLKPPGSLAKPTRAIRVIDGLFQHFSGWPHTWPPLPRQMISPNQQKKPV
jgi:hypothetical protein